MLYLGIAIALIVLEGMNIQINSVDLAPEVLGTILMFGGCLQMSRYLKNTKVLKIGFGFIVYLILSLSSFPFGFLITLFRLCLLFILFREVNSIAKDQASRQLTNWFILIYVFLFITSCFDYFDPRNELVGFVAVILLIIKCVLAYCIALRLWRIDQNVDDTIPSSILNTYSNKQLVGAMCIALLSLIILVKPVQNYLELHSATTRYFALESETNDLYIDHFIERVQPSFYGINELVGKGFIYINEELLESCEKIVFQSKNATQYASVKFLAVDERIVDAPKAGYKQIFLPETYEQLHSDNSITLYFLDGSKKVYPLTLKDRSKQFEVYDAIGEKVALRGIKVYDGMVYEIERIECDPNIATVFCEGLGYLETNVIKQVCYERCDGPFTSIKIYDDSMHLNEEVQVVKR